jgi:hypothetical protein
VHIARQKGVIMVAGAAAAAVVAMHSNRLHKAAATTHTITHMHILHDKKIRP